MTVSVRVESNLDEFTEKQKAVLREYRPEVRRLAGIVGGILLSQVKANLNGSTKIKGLAQSWTKEAPISEDFTASTVLFSTHPMARLRDEGSGYLPGGKILPGKNVVKAGPNKGNAVTRALAVPIMANLTKLGMVKGTAETWETKLLDQKWGRDYSSMTHTAGVRGRPTIEFIPRKGKPPILALSYPGKGEEKIGARIEPLFVLKKSQALAPHPYIRPAIEAKKAEMDKRIADGLGELLSMRTRVFGK